MRGRGGRGCWSCMAEGIYRCPIAQGLAAFAVCQAKGVESRFLCFGDEGRWVLGRENSLRWHRAVVGWCDRFCGVERGVGGVELR